MNERVPQIMIDKARAVRIEDELARRGRGQAKGRRRASLGLYLFAPSAGRAIIRLNFYFNAKFNGWSGPQIAIGSGGFY
jgi:hypothetical protein